MSLVLNLISSPLFWLDIALSVSGGVLVYWGLRIEKNAEKQLPPEDFSEHVFRDVIDKQRGEIERGWRILMTGIVIEVVAALAVSVISGLEMAEANERSKVAGRQAAEAVAQTKTLESTNLALRVKLVELELRMQPRIITPEKLTNFIFLTQKLKKVPVKILTGFKDDESEGFAAHLRQMLNEAGFTFEPNGQPWAIDRDRSRLISEPIERYEKPPDVYLLTSNTNYSAANIGETNIPFTIPHEVVNGRTRPISVTGSAEEISEALTFCFGKLGITVVWIHDAPRWLSGAEWGLFVPQKIR
jgi:hypothetical protein